jgi:hypothetical protein
MPPRLERSGLRPAGPSFGLGALLLGVCLLAACLAAARVHPLLAIVLAILSATAWLRTAQIVGRCRLRGQSLTSGRKLAIFLVSALRAVVAAAAACGAAGLVGLAGLGAGLCLEHVFAEAWMPVMTMTWGLVAGLLLGALTVERLWRSSGDLEY